MDRLDSYIGEIRKPKQRHFLVPMFFVGSVVVFALFAWASLKLAAL